MTRAARFIVGIDLGTTHTVVAYADTQSGSATPSVQLFEVEQLVATGEIAPRPLLPSSRYHPAESELGETDVSMPFDADTDRERGLPAVLGELALSLGAKTPGRLISSAKSWLSHTAVDRTADILPWGAPPEVRKVSPVAASASYLRHVRLAWARRFPEHPLDEAEVVLTVPASFDEGARALTFARGA